MAKTISVGESGLWVGEICSWLVKETECGVKANDSWEEKVGALAVWAWLGQQLAWKARVAQAVAQLPNFR